MAKFKVGDIVQIKATADTKDIGNINIKPGYVGTVTRESSDNVLSTVSIDGRPVFTAAVEPARIEVGDTVEVIDDRGGVEFTKGEKLTVKSIDSRGIDKPLIYVEEHDGGMYDFRFKLIKKGNSKMAIAKVGSKYKYYATTTVYEVVYSDEAGVLVKWEGSNNSRAWIAEKDFFRDYREVIPEQWAVIYKLDAGAKPVLDTVMHASEAQAREYYKKNYPHSRAIVTVVRLDK